MEAWRLVDLHAYVDDCLEPHERLAFEKKMAEEPALARRAAMWRAQNSAIRSAFDGEGPKAFSISIVRHQNDSLPEGPAARFGRSKTFSRAILPVVITRICGRLLICGEGRRCRRVSAGAVMEARARGIVCLSGLCLVVGRASHPREGACRGRRRRFPRIRPSGRRPGRNLDWRQGGIAGVADRASLCVRFTSPPPLQPSAWSERGSLHIPARRRPLLFTGRKSDWSACWSSRLMRPRRERRNFCAPTVVTP